MFEFILYVSNQEKSTHFYSELLGLKPELNVPGMTEFLLADNVKLGLMPETGIEKILYPFTRKPSEGSGIPRCELYLEDQSPNIKIKKAINLGAKLIQEEMAMNWGDSVAYCSDLDGHILAFYRRA